MVAKRIIFIASILATFGTLSAIEPTYKLCVTSKEKQYCKGLKKGDSPLDCDEVNDYSDCAQRISAGYADFGVLTAEAVAVTASFEDSALRATHQVRHMERSTDDKAFHSVVVVRNSFSGSLSRAKFCHPGFSDSRAWTDRVLKRVERSSIIGEHRICDAKKSVLENELASAARFFGPSCRPGEWTPDENQDRKLKRSYHSLCDLCDNPSRCSYNTQGTGSHIAALKCLHQRGDAAYVDIEYVREYFGLDGKSISRANASEYSFFCEDHTRRSLKDGNPCPWVSQPWPAIVANVNKSQELSAKVNDWLLGPRNRAIENWRDYLSSIILKNDSYPSKLSTPQTMKEYSGPQLRTPTKDPCDQTIRWCTSTAVEENKCFWLARAVETHDLSPRLECVQPTESGPWSCLAAVRDGLADIVSSDSTYAEIARRQYGLRPLLYQETDNDNAYKILAVVRNGSSITKLGDLTKQQKAAACFNQYGSIAMSAWLGMEQKRLRRCPTNQDILKIFPKVCAPGADNEVFNFTQRETEPLCTQCAARPETLKPGASGHTCTANETNLYYGDLGALRCLQDRRADVAFIDLRGVPEENRTLSSEYRVLCRNGSVSTQAGLNVDFDCSLSEGIGGEILTHRNVTTKSANALYLLHSMQLSFDPDQGRYGDDVVLDMFADAWGANRVRGVLFKPSTLGLVDLTDTRSPQVHSFAELQDRRQRCNPNSAHTLSPTYLTMSFVILAAFIAGHR